MAKIISSRIKDQRQVIRNTHWNVLEARFIKSYVFSRKYESSPLTRYTGGANFEAAARAASETRRKKSRKEASKEKRCSWYCLGDFPWVRWEIHITSSEGLGKREREASLFLHAVRWPGLGGRGYKFCGCVVLFLEELLAVQN